MDIPGVVEGLRLPSQATEKGTKHRLICRDLILLHAPQQLLHLVEIALREKRRRNISGSRTRNVSVTEYERSPQVC